MLSFCLYVVHLKPYLTLFLKTFTTLLGSNLKNQSIFLQTRVISISSRYLNILYQYSQTKTFILLFFHCKYISQCPLTQFSHKALFWLYSFVISCVCFWHSLYWWLLWKYHLLRRKISPIYRAHIMFKVFSFCSTWSLGIISHSSLSPCPLYQSNHAIQKIRTIISFTGVKRDTSFIWQILCEAISQFVCFLRVPPATALIISLISQRFQGARETKNNNVIFMRFLSNELFHFRFIFSSPRVFPFSPARKRAKREKWFWYGSRSRWKRADKFLFLFSSLMWHRSKCKSFSLKLQGDRTLIEVF